MSEETRDVTKQESGSLATLDFVADSGMGLENVDKQDLALPFLKAPKPVCSIIQLLKNCIMEKKE